MTIATQIETKTKTKTKIQISKISKINKNNKSGINRSIFKKRRGRVSKKTAITIPSPLRIFSLDGGKKIRKFAVHKSTNDIYFLLHGSNAIYKYDSGLNQVSIISGSENEGGYIDATTLEDARFNNPTSIAIDQSSKVIYISEQDDRIRMLHETTNFVTTIAIKSDNQPHFTNPRDIVVNDLTNDLFILTSEGRLFCLSPESKLEELELTVDLDYHDNEEEDIFAFDLYGLAIDSERQILYSIDRSSSPSGELVSIRHDEFGFLIRKEGNVFFTDNNNNNNNYITLKGLNSGLTFDLVTGRLLLFAYDSEDLAPMIVGLGDDNRATIIHKGVPTKLSSNMIEYQEDDENEITSMVYGPNGLLYVSNNPDGYIDMINVSSI